ncbi:hypothetical protein [Streptomyces alanosinicus]|uniref:hypothetical protein n=1 Tax=Streptomyces alanosinicus TaxID=68171 RepID=UPI00167884CC
MRSPAHQHVDKHRLSRRGLFTLGGGLAAAGALGGGIAAFTGAGADAAQPGAAAGAVKPFAHPGLLVNAGDLHRARVRVAAGRDPWPAGWRRLTANPHAQSIWQPRPQATVYRGAGSGQNYRTLYNDIHAAYQNALRWGPPSGGGSAARRPTATPRSPSSTPGRPPSPPSLATPTGSWPPGSTATSSRPPPNSSATTRTSRSPASRRCCARSSAR